MRHTSVEVPPISSVSTLSKPASLATHCAPATPPAGPLSNMFTGASSAASNDINPPSERSSFRSAPTPRDVSSCLRLER